MYYLITVWNDVEPELSGPYADELDRDRAAWEQRYQEGDEHGLYWMNTHYDVWEIPAIGAYRGGFFEEECP